MLNDPRLPVRFWNKVSVNPLTRCWEWTASLIEGYGQFPFQGDRLAHRIAFKAFKGPIPAGLEIDHLCRVRRCCNPDHLEAVPHRVNVRRGLAGTVAAERSWPMQCPKGHPYDAENTLYATTKRGYRVRRCRACMSAKNAKYHREHRAEILSRQKRRYVAIHQEGTSSRRACAT